MDAHAESEATLTGRSISPGLAMGAAWVVSDRPAKKLDSAVCGANLSAPRGDRPARAHAKAGQLVSMRPSLVEMLAGIERRLAPRLFHLLCGRTGHSRFLVPAAV